MKALYRMIGVGLVTLAVALGVCAPAVAQQEIKIGAIYPLTGAAASTGLELKQAAELAADIINNPNAYPGVRQALGPSLGLPNLKGAKIKLVFADHQGNPQVGATEAERPARRRALRGLRRGARAVQRVRRAH